MPCSPSCNAETGRFSTIHICLPSSTLLSSSGWTILTRSCPYTTFSDEPLSHSMHRDTVSYTHLTVPRVPTGSACESSISISSTRVPGGYWARTQLSPYLETAFRSPPPVDLLSFSGASQAATGRAAYPVFVWISSWECTAAICICP